MIRRIILGLLVAVVAATAGAAVWLAVAPPELLRVGDGYAAKIVCSNVFLAGRDPVEVLNNDVQAPGNPLLKLVAVSVDKAAGIVTARMLGFIATGTAVYRPGLGCAAVPDGNVPAAQTVKLAVEKPAVVEGTWPQGDDAGAPDPKLAAILADPKLAGPQMRAIVVVKDGRIVGEAYGEGFGPETPLLGWSMTKTVNALLLGRLVLEGRVGLDEAGLFPAWQQDERKAIRVRDLLSMTSGLRFNEDYGDVSDVTRMLYLEPDEASFAAGQPLAANPGTKFSYSTGTAVLLTRIWMDRVGDAAAALAYPRTALFDPLGMRTAVLEADEAGTLSGSSYLYASARDWARIGQLLLQDGMWNGTRLEPEALMQMMRTSNGMRGGYSQAQTWLLGPRETDSERLGLPADTFWLAGHDGQSVAIIPSAKLVVVRMGLTPSKLGYGPEPLVKAILAASDSSGG